MRRGHTGVNESSVKWNSQRVLCIGGAVELNVYGSNRWDGSSSARDGGNSLWWTNLPGTWRTFDQRRWKVDGFERAVLANIVA